MQINLGRIKDFLIGRNVPPENVIVAHTISRTKDLDSQLRVRQLVPPPDGAERFKRNEGAQQSIVGSLLDDIVSEPDISRFRTFVLTGEAGVGKSTALRAIARELALRFRDRVDRIPLLPITLPLQQVTVPRDLFSPSEAGEKLLSYLIGYWCTWASGLGQGITIKLNWLRSWLREYPSVLILDGLDEFLINNAWIDSEMVAAILSSFGSTLRENGSGIKSHTVVLAMRNSYPGHTQFATKRKYVFLIEKLTSDQALKIYPDMKDVIDDLQGTTTLPVLLTPLVLSWLGPRAKELRAESLQSKSAVMRYALDAIIDESHFGDRFFSSFSSDNMSNVRATLSIIGWLFFHSNKGNMSLSEIQAQSQALAEQWNAQVKDLRQADEMMRAFQLLADEEALQILMNRTVFVSTGVDQWRFAHREWQDFLTASYMASAYRHSNFVEMGQRAMTQAIFQMIGEILITLPERFEVTEEFTERILERGGLAVVNLAGVIGSGTFVVYPRAIQKLLSIDVLDRMDKTARLVLFTGSMYRALRRDPADASASDLRRSLIIVCNAYGSGQENPNRDALSASLAWCHHRAMAADDERITPPQSEWPKLGFEPNHEVPVLSMLTAGKEQQFRIEPRHRSLQVAWLKIVPIVLENPYRPISVAHYLYAVVVAYRHGVHIPEISAELPHILADDSPYARVFREYKAVPEVWTLFNSCQKAYRNSSLESV